LISPRPDTVNRNYFLFFLFPCFFAVNGITYFQTQLLLFETAVFNMKDL